MKVILSNRMQPITNQQDAQENLADIMHKLLIIYKYIQLIHNELRYQAKIHEMFEKLSK
jgi:hypothetical protein